jgi:GTPase
MLADHAKICAVAGRGGNGSVSFRREKYVPRGGPDGGDGGRGGDVYLVASQQLRDLSPYIRRIHHKAANGGHGAGAGKKGAGGDSLRIPVPVGTEVHTLTGELLADLATPGAELLVARGGEPGRGNMCFVSSTRRAPHFAERGLDGEEQWLLLRMKLLADVGLVGLPNAGKSSLLAVLTRAKPRIAAYPFTTIEPNLGVCELDDGSFVTLADIPGLIEGASQGIGLGDEFLAHIERTSVLLYVVDASDGPDQVASALETVRGELAAFKPGLAGRPAVIAVNKTDLVDESSAAAAAAAARDSIPGRPQAAIVSAVAGQGLPELRSLLTRAFATAHEESIPEQRSDHRTVLRPGGERASDIQVEREKDLFRVHGAVIERLVAKADLANDEAVAYLQEVMERAGVDNALRRAGAGPGDTVVIGDLEFEFR